MLKSAKKPLILAGGGVNISHAGEKLKKFMEKENVPVVTTIMGKGAVPTTHPLYIGNCGMHGKYAANMAVMECDLLFSIGTRFNDRITGDLMNLHRMHRLYILMWIRLPSRVMWLWMCQWLQMQVWRLKSC